LTLEEAAFLLGESKRAVQNCVRRGAFRPIFVGRLRRLDPVEVGKFLLASESYLALEYLCRLVEGRITAPRLSGPDAQPPALADCLDLLDRGSGAGIELEVRTHA
jgi:excisionase family DNA binding protein